MAYVTKQEMIDRYGEKELIDLTDRAAPYTDAIVDSVLDQAMADADQDVDAWLRPRYSLPLATVPSVITRIACEIARYHLHKDRATDDVKDRYKESVKTLERISKRQMDIGIDEAEPASQSSEIEVTAPDRIFNQQTLNSY